MSIYLALFANSSSSVSPFFPVLLVLFGIVFFILGFRIYRQYRIMADTPLFPVRSVPMGLVHVSGKSTGGNPLIAPLTQVPCYHYKVTVEKLVKKNDKEEWEKAGTESSEVPFYLEDATGKILVQPQRAEFDVPRSFWGEVRPRALLSFGQPPRKMDESLGVPMPTDEHLLAYVKGQFSRARAGLQGSHIPGGEAMDTALGIAEKMQALGVSVDEGAVRVGFDDHTYRLAEYCLVAGRVANVMGTCAENPAPTEEHDRNLIKRGENEKTFLITTKSEKQIEKSLRRKALSLIVLGAAIIVAGVAFALHSAHML